MATKQERYQYRKDRSRGHLLKNGAHRPRLSVYRSLKYMYAQIVDDNTHSTLVSATTLSKEFEGKFDTSAKSIEAAKALGCLNFILRGYKIIEIISVRVFVLLFEEISMFFLIYSR